MAVERQRQEVRFRFFRLSSTLPSVLCSSSVAAPPPPRLSPCPPPNTVPLCLFVALLFLAFHALCSGVLTVGRVVSLFQMAERQRRLDAERRRQEAVCVCVCVRYGRLRSKNGIIAPFE